MLFVHNFLLFGLIYDEAIILALGICKSVQTENGTENLVEYNVYIMAVTKTIFEEL